MYGQVNWEGRGHHNYQVPPLQDIQLPPMEEAGISDVDSIRSKNVYDYPVFFDIGQNQYITGKERKKLKEGKAKSKWDFFYRYSPNAMDQIKYKRLSYLDSELQKREQVRKGKIRDQQEKIRKFKNLKAKIRRSRIIMIIVASIITIASLGISFYNKETCCFYTTGLFFIILIIVIIIAGITFIQRIIVTAKALRE